MTNTTKLTADTITDDQIEALEAEAAQAGDDRQIELCRAALQWRHDAARGMVEGHNVAAQKCADAINEARARG